MTPRTLKMNPKGSRVEQFLSTLSSASESFLILSHHNPDPDSLASAAALRYLIGEKLAKTSTIGFSGIIGRAQNRALVTVLDVPLVPAEEILPEFKGSIILVDTQPGLRNNPLPSQIEPLAVIDHHPDWGHTASVAFLDLRENYGATSTILTSYLQEVEVPINSTLATALFYGISSETQHLGRETIPQDILASQLLYPYVDKRSLAKIENPPLSRDYYGLVSRATDNAVLFGDVVAAILEWIPYPDAVAEVADFLLRLENVSWSICLAPYDQFLYISVRSSNPEAKAGRLLASLLPTGQAGGHGTMAGGLLKKSEKNWKGDASKLLQHLLKALKKEGSKAEPLVVRRG